jgi:hypothetical protein
MNRIAVAAFAGALLVGCAAPAPAPLARPAPVEQTVTAWSDLRAEAHLRGALARRGYAPEVVEGVVAPLSFDPVKSIVHQDGGDYQTLAGPGAWLVATQTGRFWVFENGAVVAAAEAAPR